MPHLEITEVVLVHCNSVNNYYQQDSRVLHTFFQNKLLDISSKSFIFQKKFDSEFLNIGVWLTNQSSKPLEIEYKVNITSVINSSVKYKKYALLSSTWRSNICKRQWVFIFCKKYGQIYYW